MTVNETIKQKSNEMMGIVFIALALFFSLAFYLPAIRSGFLGIFMLKISKGLFGVSAMVLPLIFLYIGLDFLLERRKNLTKTRVIHAFLALILISAFLNTVSMDYDSFIRVLAVSHNLSPEQLKASSFIVDMWNLGYSNQNFTALKSLIPGGVLGSTLSCALNTFFGKIGSLIIISALLICQAILLFNLSISRLLKNTGKTFKSDLISSLKYKWNLSKGDKAALKNAEIYMEENEVQTSQLYYEHADQALKQSTLDNDIAMAQDYRRLASLPVESMSQEEYERYLELLQYRREKVPPKYNPAFGKEDELNTWLKRNPEMDDVDNEPYLRSVPAYNGNNIFSKAVVSAGKFLQDNILNDEYQDKVEGKINLVKSGSLEERKNVDSSVNKVETGNEREINTFNTEDASNFSTGNKNYRKMQLKPARMVNPVPIGKILSDDEIWERPDPLEEDLHVRRVSSTETQISNLEILSKNEESISKPKVPEIGSFYGVKQGEKSNLHLMNMSEDGRSYVQVDKFKNIALSNDNPLSKFRSAASESSSQTGYIDHLLSTGSEIIDMSGETKTSADEEKIQRSNQDTVNYELNSTDNYLSNDTDILRTENSENFNVELSKRINNVHQDEAAKYIDFGEGTRLSFIDDESFNTRRVHTLEEKSSLSADALDNVSLNLKLTGGKLINSVEKTMLNKGLLRKMTYRRPPLAMLKPETANLKVDKEALQAEALHLEETLQSFGVNAKVINVTTGPSITRFEVQPGVGVKVSKIVSLADDIALSLAATSVRIEAPIPGKPAVGIEIPNKETKAVGLRALLEDESFVSAESPLTVALGRDISGMPVLCDLSKMPHLLIAGATGSGKSVCINSILVSLLYKSNPDKVKLILIDPKVVELKVYNDIPHLIAPVVTDPKKAANTLNWALAEMARRYALFAEKNVRNIKSYNESLKNKANLGDYNDEEFLPLILIVIDELADLMATAANDVEDAIARLTAMSRAAGIHLIIATQRPSVDVLTGVIKANIPSRIAFSVSSQIDSRTILDGAGAEKLLGKGDMLYAPLDASKSIRAQGAFVSDSEVEALVDYVKTQNFHEYDEVIVNAINSAQTANNSGTDTMAEDASGEDPALIKEAMNLILEYGQASTSVLQRRLRLGHSRASRIIDYFEEKGYIGPYCGSKPRELRINRRQWEEILSEENNG